MAAHNKTLIISEMLYRSKYWGEIQGHVGEVTKDLGIIVVAEKGYKSNNFFAIDNESVTMPQLLAHKNATICLTIAEPAAIMESLYYGVPVILFAENDEHRALAKRVERAAVGAYISDIKQLDQTITKMLDEDSSE